MPPRLLRASLARSKASYHPQWRRLTRSAHTAFHPLRDPDRGPQDIAIVGGGVTGLSAALELLQIAGSSQRMKVTVYDSKPRLGGWVQSEFIDVPGGKILFEKAVRTLRAAGGSGLVSLLLIHQLGLEEELVTCPRTSPAAKNRYLYYPDHLVRMPSAMSDIYRFLQEPLAEGVAPGAIREFLAGFNLGPGAGKNWKAGKTDSSIGDLLSQRFGPSVANIASAVLHGIYAGNVDRLSANALMPGLVSSLREHGGIIRGSLAKMVDATTSDRIDMSADEQSLRVQVQGIWGSQRSWREDQPRIAERLAALKQAQESSVFSFKKGVQQLTDKMVETLCSDSRVTIRSGREVSSIKVNTKGMPNVEIRAPSDDDATQDVVHNHTHVISTLPSTQLSNLLGLNSTSSNKLTTDEQSLKNILAIPSVSVMVVNLWFPQPDLIPVQGFGYLIPRDIPVEENPELGLGCVFDSDAIQGQDTVAGTKLTVMLGGHHWNSFRKEWLPSEAEGIERARSLIARHLGITAEPGATQATMQWNCIPQYEVGHVERMARLEAIIKGPTFKHRLLVAGASYEGVGVNDCIRSGRRAAQISQAPEVDTDKWQTWNATSKAPISLAQWKFT